jgi:hypothetical protein
MKSNYNSEQNKYPDNELHSCFWIDPNIRTAVSIAANDIIIALCGLEKTMESALEETRCESGDIQSSLFSHLIGDSSSFVATRIEIFKLLTAILCEQNINRFCYFELPRNTAEALEKLQPAEKFVVAADFLTHTNVKSSHVHEGLKQLISWRNQFAHGHNPGRSMRSLHKNHAVFPKIEEFTTLADEISSVRKAAIACRELTMWLKKYSRNSISADSDNHSLSLFIEKLACFSITKAFFPPDPEGSQYAYESLSIDFEKLKHYDSC